MGLLNEIHALLPDNTAREISEGDLRDSFSKTFQEIDKSYKKVDAPYYNSNYVLLADGTPKAAGDLGKNVANSSLTSVAGAGLVLGANWTVNTSGYYYVISGLTDGSNDNSVDMLLAQNSSGRLFKTNAKEALKKLPNILSQAEKEQFGIAWNNQYSNGSLNVYSITPTVIKNDHTVRYLVLQGLNLNLNPAATSVKFIPVANSIGTGEINCLGFQTFSDGKTMIVSVYGDSLPPGVQYNLIIRTTSPIIQTHRTTSYISVVSNLDNIDLNQLGWQKKAYTDGQEENIFTTNGAIFSYTANASNKPFAFDLNSIVGIVKSNPIFPAGSNFYLEINFSLSSTGTNAVSETTDFLGYLGLMQASIPLVLLDNSFLRIINSSFRSGGYQSVGMYNNQLVPAYRIEPGTSIMNANLIVMRQGNIYTQFLTVGSTTIIQSITSITEAISISLAVTNGTTQKKISGSIVQAFTF